MNEVKPSALAALTPGEAKNTDEQVDAGKKLPEKAISTELIKALYSKSIYGARSGILLVGLPFELLRIILGMLGKLKDISVLDQALSSSKALSIQWRRFLQGLRSPAFSSIIYPNMNSVRWVLSRGVDLRNFKLHMSADDYNKAMKLDPMFRNELCKTRGMQMKIRDMTYFEMITLFDSLSKDDMEGCVESYFDLLYSRQQLAKLFDENAHLGCDGRQEDYWLKDIIADEDDDDGDDDWGRTRQVFERVYCNFLEKKMHYWPKNESNFCEACMAHFPKHDDSYVAYWPPRKFKYKRREHEQWIKVYGACRECDSDKEWIRCRDGDY